MKSILISIKPKWVAKILNGEKTIEIRKTMPKCDLPIDVYIYCTKGINNKSVNLWVSKTEERCKKAILNDAKWDSNLDEFMNYEFPKKYPKYFGGRVCFEPINLNGKVVAKFTLNKVEEIKQTERHDIELLEKSCLTATELYDYLLNKLTFNNVIGYAWHISNLVIFDKPKELSEFKTLKRAKATDCFVCDVYQLTEMCIGKRCLLPKPLTKAPQNFCYVEVE